MNNKNKFLGGGKAGLLLGAFLLVGIAQCPDNASGQNVQVNVGQPVAPEVAVQDSYLYYPKYGVYFNARRHQYRYMKGDKWVSARVPEGVSADVLLASPSVKMDFHDSPEKHHKEIVQKYPKNWAPHDDHRDGDHNGDRK